MATNTYQQLLDAQKKLAKLQAQVAKDSKQLLSLPSKFGFKSMNEFIGALQMARKTGTTGGAAPKPVAAGARKPRAKITPEIKAKLKALVNDGKTGGEIARTLGISLPSVQNIKKELGLVKERK